MQPSTPYSPYETDPQPRHELLSGTPEAGRLVEQAQEYVNNAYDHQRREEQQAGVGRAAIDQQGLRSKSPETVNLTPQAWVLTAGIGLEKIRRNYMDHTMMYGETSMTTSSAEKAVNNNFPLPPQDVSRVTNQGEVDLAA